MTTCSPPPRYHTAGIVLSIRYTSHVRISACGFGPSVRSGTRTSPGKPVGRIIYRLPRCRRRAAVVYIILLFTFKRDRLRDTALLVGRSDDFHFATMRRPPRAYTYLTTREYRAGRPSRVHINRCQAVARGVGEGQVAFALRSKIKSFVVAIIHERLTRAFTIHVF